MLNFDNTGYNWKTDHAAKTAICQILYLLFFLRNFSRLFARFAGVTKYKYFTRRADA